MKTFYLIGASGVGKSTISRELAREIPEIERIQLDEIYEEYRKRQNNHELAIQKTKERVQEIESIKDEKIYVIDIGAYAQKHVETEFWRDRSASMICIKNTEEFCYGNYRARGGNRMDLVKWRKSEFGGNRSAVYACAKYVVDSTGLDLHTTKEEVFRILEKLKHI